MKKPPSSPARKFGKAGQEMWNLITSEFDISDASGIALLTQILQRAGSSFAAERTNLHRRLRDLRQGHSESTSGDARRPVAVTLILITGASMYFAFSAVITGFDRQWPAAPVSSQMEELRGYFRP